MACTNKKAVGKNLGLCDKCKIGANCFNCGLHYRHKGACYSGGVCEDHAYLASCCFICGKTRNSAFQAVMFCQPCTTKSNVGGSTFSHRCCAFGASNRHVPPPPASSNSNSNSSSTSSSTSSSSSSASYGGGYLQARLDNEDTLEELLQRNLEDDQKKKVEYLAKIGELTGKEDVQILFDEENIRQGSSGMRNALTGKTGFPVTQVVYDWFLGATCHRLSQFMEHPINREALPNYWKTNIIRWEFRNERGPTGKYVSTDFSGGDMTIYLIADDIYSFNNVTHDWDCFMIHDDWPLPVARDWYDSYENHGKQNLKTIGEATGKENVDYLFNDREVYEATKAEGNTFYPGRLMWEEFLGNLTTHIVDICNDPKKKEILLTAWPSNMIRFEFAEGPSIQNLKIDENGDLIHFCLAENICSNRQDLGWGLFDIANLKAKSANASASGIPAEAAVDLEETAGDLQRALKKIEAYTGKKGVEFKFDAVAVCNALSNREWYEKDKPGTVLIRGILSSFAEGLDYKDSVKSKLLEKWKTNVIRFEFGEGPYTQNARFDSNGDFVFYATQENFTSNHGDCRHHADAALN